MCGIAGSNLSPAESAADSKLIATKMFEDIVTRGRDATGAGWFAPDGTLMVHKDAMPARWFAPHLAMEPEATNFILHTRFGTKGSEKDNNNNHPVVVEGVVGVHNGCISNDDMLFQWLGVPRIAQVDTEAAFAAIAHGSRLDDNGKPLIGDLKDILEMIDGSAALAWHTVGEPDVLHLARIWSSPLVVCTTEGGSTLFASTKSAISSALRASGLTDAKFEELAWGTYLRIKKGEEVERFTFDPVGMARNTSYSYGSTTVSKVGTTTVGSSCDIAPPPPPVTTTAKTEPVTQTTSAFVPYIRDHVIGLHVNHALYQGIVCGEDDWVEQYENRSHAIDRWIKEHNITATDAMNDAGVFASPGDWVSTNLPGFEEEVTGELWILPQSFPTGEYLIRVWAPNARYDSGYEPIIVSRQFDEFVTIKTAKELDAEDTATTTEAEVAEAVDAAYSEGDLSSLSFFGECYAD